LIGLCLLCHPASGATSKRFSQGFAPSLRNFSSAERESLTTIGDFPLPGILPQVVDRHALIRLLRIFNQSRAGGLTIFAPVLFWLPLNLDERDSLERLSAFFSSMKIDFPSPSATARLLSTASYDLPETPPGREIGPVVKFFFPQVNSPIPSFHFSCAKDRLL